MSISSTLISYKCFPFENILHKIKFYTANIVPYNRRLPVPQETCKRTNVYLSHKVPKISLTELENNLSHNNTHFMLPLNNYILYMFIIKSETFH